MVLLFFFFSQKVLIFLFLHKKLSLDIHLKHLIVRDAPNEYSCFCVEMRKYNILCNLFSTASLESIKLACRGNI